MNQLYYGDNLQVLREHIGSESVDLIFLDPPLDNRRPNLKSLAYGIPGSELKLDSPPSEKDRRAAENR